MTESQASSKQRIAILGPTGSGKSRLGERLGAILEARVVELDALFHQPDWQPTPVEEFQEKVRSALEAAGGRWVCIGNYTSMIGDIVLPQSDTIVWLRLPFRLTFWRLLKRTVRRAWSRELLWGTNRESWRKSFLDRESILWWSITQRNEHFRRMREALRTIEHRARIVELRSDVQVDEFVDSISRKSAG